MDLRPICEQEMDLVRAGRISRACQQMMFETTSHLLIFWIIIKITQALKTLLSFPTIYPCEAGLLATETRLQSRLDIRNTHRVSLFPITPRWDDGTALW